MNEILSRLFAEIDREADSMFAMWRSLVQMESPSADRDAVARLAAHLDTYCDAMDMDRQIYSFEKAGPTFAAWTREEALPPIALIGHMDTVHPAGAFGPDAFRVEGDIVTGPGVYDCKGGVTAGIFAIRALKRIGWHRRQLKLVLSGDEEAAHAYSEGEGGHLFEQHAENCAAVFNCESGAAGEEVTIGRRGGAIFGIRIYGKAAHAGREPWKGASAVLQAARMIERLEEASDYDTAYFNCGRISGGKGANIVPDYCEMSVGLRYTTNEQYERAAALVESLCREPMVPGVRCVMDQRGFYPAMETTPKTGALLEVYRQACRELGAPLPEGIFVGGCSDSAFVTRIGVPTLCSVGVQGGDAHTLSEHAVLPSIVTQCKKLAAAIVLLPDDF